MCSQGPKEYRSVLVKLVRPHEALMGVEVMTQDMAQMFLSLQVTVKHSCKQFYQQMQIFPRGINLF